MNLNVSINAAKITRESQSNLALAFVALDRERRQDITTFYAFCRLIDDIADDVDLGVEEKQRRLNEWRTCLRAVTANEPSIAPHLRALIAKYSLTPEMFDEIIAGVEMDLSISRYATFDPPSVRAGLASTYGATSPPSVAAASATSDLRTYCYRVASAVGLVSIEIFGYRNPRCREYAIELGLALQTTNIIRDVGKDLQQDRIYLPQEDLSRFGCSESDLQARKYDDRFVRLMEFEAARARKFFTRAEAALPREDRKSMVAAEIMSSVYRGLLRQMELDKFRVFEKEYRLSKAGKAGRVVGQLLKFYLN